MPLRDILFGERLASHEIALLLGGGRRVVVINVPWYLSS
jgi:hypothetical protein